MIWSLVIHLFSLTFYHLLICILESNHIKQIITKADILGPASIQKHLALTLFSSKWEFLEMGLLVKLRSVGHTLLICLHTLLIGYCCSILFKFPETIICPSLQFPLIQLLVDAPGLRECPSYFPWSAPHFQVIYILRAAAASWKPPGALDFSL